MYQIFDLDGSGNYRCKGCDRMDDENVEIKKNGGGKNMLSKFVKKKFDLLLGRWDYNEAVYYFSPKDYPRVNQKNFLVEGEYGTLKGFIY